MHIFGIRRLWVAALGLALLGWATGRAQAAALSTPIPYSSVGSVQNPANLSRGVVYLDGVTSNVSPTSSIDLVHFVVDPSINNTDGLFLNHPFQFIVSSGSHASTLVSGFLNGSVGPHSSNPALYATVTSVEAYGRDSLPFTLNIPMNSQLRLALPSPGSAIPATTALMAVAGPIPAAQAAPIPEPASIAIFACATGALGFWHRRRSAG